MAKTTRGKAAAKEMAGMERQAKMANKIGATVKIKPPPSAGPPPNVSKTMDTYTHHTSPIKGPQPTPVEPNTMTSAPKAKIKTLPDVPMAKYKHVDEG